jgi:acyl-CoA thioester hydrolase
VSHVSVPVHIRYGDIDANGHVNNATFLTLLEEARVRTVRPSLDRASAEEGSPGRGAPRVVVARHEIDYLRSMPWSSAPIIVDVWVSRIGSSSFEVGQLMRSSDVDAPETYAVAKSVMVALTPDTQAPRRLTDGERETLGELRGEADEVLTAVVEARGKPMQDHGSARAGGVRYG